MPFEMQTLVSIFPNLSSQALRCALDATGNDPQRAAELLLAQTTHAGRFAQDGSKSRAEDQHQGQRKSNSTRRVPASSLWASIASA